MSISTGRVCGYRTAKPARKTCIYQRGSGTAARIARTSVWVLPGDRERRAGADGHYSALQDAWERVREEADLPGLRLHDLRHSFASFAIADGQSLFMVAKLLGHKHTRTTERYAHLAADPILAAANKTADRIAAAMRERGNLNPVAPTSPQTRPEPNDSEAA